MKKQIKLEILRALNRCSTYLLPEARLLDQVRLLVRPEPLADEIRAEVRELNAEGCLVAGRSYGGGS